MTTFAMALVKKPISAQKRGKKRRYQQEIREAAMLRVGKTKLPLLDGVYIEVGGQQLKAGQSSDDISLKTPKAAEND